MVGRRPEPMPEPAVAAPQEPSAADVVAPFALAGSRSSDDRPGDGQEATEPSEEELEALEWACGLQRVDVETLRALRAALGRCVIEAQVEKRRQFKAQLLLAKSLVEEGPPDGSSAAGKGLPKAAKPRRRYV